ncbi:hypothetical protein Pmani_022628 [Petrolisthes manimaculis]|uniref:C2H2-type domain-containing protein n=1 Tax=Petrolisthes manimaculis TaxID=1843537 RepID=A0AAE1PE37_9EUCA|nr:hypothetical protein Pmani_022628 [Petrolisthes manimaculis]
MKYRVDGLQLRCVDSFKYLGSTIFVDGSLDKEITSRIQKASQALGRLRLEACASDRLGWRSLTSRATAAFEEDRRRRLAAARDRRHRAASTSVQNTNFQCNTCGRLCASSFGLQSHMRRHR